MRNGKKARAAEEECVRKMGEHEISKLAGVGKGRGQTSWGPLAPGKDSDATLGEPTSH